MDWRELHCISVLVAEVGEGVELVDNSTASLGLGEGALAGDDHEVVALGGADGPFIRALPGAVVDLVGEGETLVLLSEGAGLARHGLVVDLARYPDKLVNFVLG